MALEALSTPRFIRKTQLGANEYRKNFHQIDADVMATVTSPEVDRVTPLMSKIYLRLVSAPPKFWERQGVLRFEAEVREGKQVIAWAQMCELLGVASATARKALAWMHEVGVIGYFAGKNGVGIRIFINRASASVGTRVPQSKKILAFSPTSSDVRHTSTDEMPFNDSFAVPEILDTDINSRAPKIGADTKKVDKNLSEPTPSVPADHYPNMAHGIPRQGRSESFSLENIITRLRSELEPAMYAAARQAAAREHERTREWLENRGLPKAARVAQHEAYNVLKKYGVINEASHSSRSQLEVGRNSYVPPDPHTLSDDEVNDLAQACVAMLEIQGQSIEMTLSEMSVEAGGFLLPEDAGRVRQKANSVLSVDNSVEGK
jgi:hypothetical protein